MAQASYLAGTRSRSPALFRQHKEAQETGRALLEMEMRTERPRPFVFRMNVRSAHTGDVVSGNPNTVHTRIASTFRSDFSRPEIATATCCEKKIPFQVRESADS